MRGLVCKLFKCNDERYQVALEGAAGARVSFFHFSSRILKDKSYRGLIFSYTM